MGTDYRDIYQDVFARRSASDLRLLAQIKRFVERYDADAGFREDLCSEADPQAVTSARGIDVDVAQLAPIFDPAYADVRHTPKEEQWPQVKLWWDYLADLNVLREAMRGDGGMTEINPAFDAWRKRQINRSMSELRASGSKIPHAIAAYELSEGCSVGCWFCGLSAESFKQHMPYSEANASLWKGVLGAMVETFGKAAGSGFCYWATDPADNPHYDLYQRDHYEITGVLPQATTAAPFKDFELFKRMKALSDQVGSFPLRVSVLNLKILDRLHAEFTADELLKVSLLAQTKGSNYQWANAGRGRTQSAERLAKGQSLPYAPNDEHTTIACVTGLLVNMPNRTIKMVSPTVSSDRWPNGYRIFDEATFDTPKEFHSAVDGMIARQCKTALDSHDRLAFRPDLDFTPRPDGFELRSSTRIHQSRGGDLAIRLGEFIRSGTHTVKDVQRDVTQSFSEIFRVMEMLQSLFDRGLLDDDPKFGGIAPASMHPQRVSTEQKMPQLADAS